jgi:hypothetical protein
MIPTLLRASRGAVALLFVSLAGAPERAGAQAAAFALAPSGRASTVVEITKTVPRDTPPAQRPPALHVAIDYGQPHLRGRDALSLMPLDTAWRTGANSATGLTTDVNLMVNGTLVPKGSYTLFTIRSKSGTKLIINKQVGQWGTQYDAKQDLARVDMRTRRITDPLDALQIALVPAATGVKGVLRIVWGTVALECDWEAKP